ncbi:MAG: UvrB/UvrC motif-containing protein [Patescibacteria group bacterium]
MKREDVDFKGLPDTPGVYFFVASDGTTLYVGKATSLRDRVRSYFANDLTLVRSPLVAKVVVQAAKVTFEACDSVLEALILEAKYIKKLKPEGNTAQKDDKSWAYLAVTNDIYPRFLIFRGRELQTVLAPKKIKNLYGPFMSGASLREALKIVRRIFPFFDTEFEVDGALSTAQKKKLAFNQSIGLYPRTLDRTAYLRTVRSIELIFAGKMKSLLQDLERDMHKASKAEKFEEAEIYKRQLFALRHIHDVSLIKDESRAPSSTEFRIEAYDTAHLRGEAARGVMVVVVDGEPKKSDYRIFTIRSSKAGDDYAALKEVLDRRLAHTEWPMSQLIVVDGGKGQLAVARRAVRDAKKNITVCAVTKNERHKPKQIVGPKTLVSNHKSSILLANSEAHRFSITKHRRALRKGLAPRQY